VAHHNRLIMINTTMKRVVLYPGRFQPMLPHHAEVYQHLVAQFPDADVYIATSNKVEMPKSPFDAKEKSEIMTQLHDIPADKILIVRSPYNANEYQSVFDMENTVAIFAVGGKDMDDDPRFSFKPKKDGSPSYLQKINTISNGEMPMTQRGYVYSAPTVNSGSEAASASAFRDSLSTAPDIDTAKKVFTDTFGKFDEKVFTLVYDKITGTDMSESLDILRILAGLSEAPVEFKPGKGKMDYEPKINRRDQADSDSRPDKAASSDPDTATFTDIAPDAMISVDTNKPINSKGRFNSIANMVPADKDPNDPQVKKELFIKLMSKSPAFLLGEINARLGTDDESLAASDRLSAIMKRVEGGSITSLPEDDRVWTLTLIKNALLNMELHRAGTGDQEEFGEPDPEENMPEESVDFSDIRNDYGIANEQSDECEQCGSADCECPPGECDCDPVEEADIEEGRAVTWTSGEKPDKKYLWAIHIDGEEEEETYHSLEQAKRVVTNRKKVAPYRKYSIKRMKRTGAYTHESTVDETASNALDAALSELRSLAGL